MFTQAENLLGLVNSVTAVKSLSVNTALCRLQKRSLMTVAALVKFSRQSARLRKLFATH